MLIVNVIDPPQPALGDPEARQLWKQAGWKNLPQRFGMYAVSLWILACAWGWGNLVLRAIRIHHTLSRLDRQFFAFGCGLSVLALLMLGFGLAGLMSRLTLSLAVASGLLCECLFIGIELFARPKLNAAAAETSVRPVLQRLQILHFWPLLVLVPFLMCYLGGAFLPEVDFDVKEYHFGGPKEWFLAQQISFLPHNVYTSFPFLTEMLTLLGMVLYGDWYWGAIAGKGVLMCFSVLTALGLFAAGRRWFSNAVGIWAALIHLSTPWIYRISIIAYAEGGLTFYLFASLFALMLLLDRIGPDQAASSHELRQNPELKSASALPLAVLAGFLAGSAMACKYPGVISVVLPIGLAGVWTTFRLSRSWRTALTVGLAFSIGVLLTIGPWLLKNWSETGNPVYPLLYSVFGGIDWSPELNAKWKHAHSPEHYRASDWAEKFIDVTFKADWLSPLLFGLAPLACWGIWNRKRVTWLWIYVAYLFGTWWLLTHRIDRFWVPLIPIVSLLAAAGACWNPAKWWRYGFGTAAGLALVFNFAFMTSSLCGYNAYLLDLNAAAEHTARITAPEIVSLNSSLRPGSKVLCVGEAELFDARFEYVYNTVFDQSIFEQWCGTESKSVPSSERPLKPAAEIKQILHDHGITHVLVNWQEILRYRTTYGYTDFVSPKRFQQLQAAGILGAAWIAPGSQDLEHANSVIREEIQRWGPELIRQESGRKSYKTFEVFPVLE
ncbi:MAG: hypothetical protein JWM11_6270 [Planctomycetaceae bacterium]|nr:hypothetical protein [Planctomycetaceae bacterium]